MEQFAALRWFFPSTLLPRGLQLEPHWGAIGTQSGPDRWPSQKTLQETRSCIGAAGAVENQQSFYSFPSVRATGRTRTAPRLTAHSPLYSWQRSLHRPMQAATGHKDYGILETVLGVNCYQQPTMQPNVPPALFWHLLDLNKMLLMYTKSESLLLELKNWPLDCRVIG